MSSRPLSAGPHTHLTRPTESRDKKSLELLEVDYFGSERTPLFYNYLRTS